MAQKNIGPEHAGRRAGAGEHVVGQRHASNNTNWREVLDQLGVTVAEAADKFKILDGVDLASLAKDIDANGMRHPLMLWRDKEGDPWQLADGRNRCAAMAWLVEGDLRIKGAIGLADRRTGGDLKALIRSLNIERRDLTPREREDRIAELLRANPTRSDRDIAAETKVDHHKVANIRKGLEHGGEISPPSERVGRDGVAQPAHKLPPSKEAQLRALRERAQEEERDLKALRRIRRALREKQTKTDPAPSPSLKRGMAIGHLCAWLRADLEGALDDLVRILRDEQDRIAYLPMDRRSIVARGLLQALGVSADDLKGRAQ